MPESQELVQEQFFSIPEFFYYYRMLLLLPQLKWMTVEACSKFRKRRQTFGFMAFQTHAVQETPIGAVEESSLDVLDRIDTTYGIPDANARSHGYM